jgi:hypothetical protein
MHKPTYITLMFLAAMYGLARAVTLWFSNKLLFTAGIFILVITILVAVLQLLDDDSFELKWMLCYSIPLGLLAIGQLAGITEMQNEALKMAHQPPLPEIIPGTSKDYQSAALGHIVSMILPFLARAMAGGVGIIMKLRK